MSDTHKSVIEKATAWWEVAVLSFALFVLGVTFVGLGGILMALLWMTIHHAPTVAALAIIAVLGVVF